jgi:hypothetical protein
MPYGTLAAMGVCGRARRDRRRRAGAASEKADVIEALAAE